MAGFLLQLNAVFILGPQKECSWIGNGKRRSRQERGPQERGGGRSSPLCGGRVTISLYNLQGFLVSQGTKFIFLRSIFTTIKFGSKSVFQACYHSLEQACACSFFEYRLYTPTLVLIHMSSRYSFLPVPGLPALVGCSFDKTSYHPGLQGPLL